MRRILSESWTFIWQPKVRMQAVLVPSDPEGAVLAARAPGLREIVTRVAVGGVAVASLIVFLRLVDADSHGDLSGTALELELPYLEEARPRRSPKYIRDGVPFLLPHHKYRTIFDRTIFDRTIFDRTIFDRTIFDRTIFDPPPVLLL